MIRGFALFSLAMILNAMPCYAQGQDTPLRFPLITDCSNLGLGCQSFNELATAKDPGIQAIVKASGPEKAYVCFPISYQDDFQIISFNLPPDSAFPVDKNGVHRGTRDEPIFFKEFLNGQENKSNFGFVRWTMTFGLTGQQSPLNPKDSLDGSIDDASVSVRYSFINVNDIVMHTTLAIRRSTLRMEETFAWDTTTTDKNGKVHHEPHSEINDGKCVEYPPPPPPPPQPSS